MTLAIMNTHELDDLHKIAYRRTDTQRKLFRKKGSVGMREE